MQILLTCKQVWFYVTPIMISINQLMSEGTDSCKAVAMEVAHMKAFGQKRFGIETVRLLLSSACVIEGQDPGTRVLHSLRPGGYGGVNVGEVYVCMPTSISIQNSRIY